MESRRHSFRGERRRRVFTEEAGYATATASSAEDAAEPPGSAESGRAYGEAVRSPQQCRVIDLVPKHRWTLWALTLLATSAAVGLLALYVRLARGTGPITLAHLPAVDLAAEGNVAQWFSSALMLTAAALGVVIYLIRRHRLDDYRGRYRMWYWMVPLMVLASADHVSHLQDAARTVLVTLLGLADPARAQWVWTATTALLAGAIAVRLAAEMSRSRVAVLVLAAAVACRAVGAAVHHGWLLHATGVFLVVYQVGAVLASNILGLLALGVYARYVYRDAHGAIPSPAPQVRRADGERAGPARSSPANRAPVASPANRAPVASPANRAPVASPAPAASATTRIDQAHVHAAPPAPVRGAQAAQDPSPREPEKRRAVPAAAAREAARAAASASTPRAGEEEEEATLSRSERRRLRKLQRRGQPAT